MITEAKGATLFDSLSDGENGREWAARGFCCVASAVVVWALTDLRSRRFVYLGVVPRAF